MIRFLPILILFLISCENEKGSKNEVRQELDELIFDARKVNSAKEGVTKLRRASKLTHTLPDDTIKSRFYRKIACEYYNYGMLETYYKQTVENIYFSKKINDTISLGKLYYDLGDYFFQKNINDSSYYYYNQALKTIPVFNGEKLRTQFNIAKLLLNENQLIESEVQLIKVIKSAQEIEDFRLLYECYSILGGIQNGLKNYKEALNSYQNSRNYLDKIGNDKQYSVLLSENYNNTANVYLSMIDYEKAIEFFEKGLKYKGIRRNSPKVYAILTDNLNYAKLKKGTLENPSGFFEAFRISDSLNNKFGMISSSQRIGEYYLQKNDSSNALRQFSIAFDLAKKTYSFSDQLTLLKLKKQVNPKKASEYQERYISLSDSLLIEERKTRNKFAKIEFETRQIEQENNILIKKMNFILILSFLLILLLSTFYFLYRQKIKNRVLILEQEQQKSNEEVYNLFLSQQQQVDHARTFEKKRISTELHDGIISELFGIRLHLERLIFLDTKLDKNKIEVYLIRLNGLETAIRQISHKLADETAFKREGFIVLVDSYLKEFENDNAIQTKLIYNTTIKWEVLSNEQKINLFRIIQEALTNIRKYAKAKEVVITFDLKEDTFRFTISDNGIGFVNSKVKNGIGLKNMRFRIENLKGNFFINSSEKGTKIELDFPIRLL